jgi:cob(I)alamin adenosyltransferase
MTLGLVQVYTGDGKGKTTTAVGLAFRAAGHGYRVCIIQFLKGAHYIGEQAAIDKNRNIKLFQFGQECPWSKDMRKGIMRCGTCRYCFTLHKDDIKRSMIGFDFAKDATTSGDYDMVILDEINVAMDKKVIPTKDVLELIKNKNPNVELVLTGRGAPREIIEAADLVTEMRDVKHPIKKDVVGRKGVDF